MSGKYGAFFKFVWQKEKGFDFIDEKGVTRCDTREQAHAIFKAKCKELSQRVFAICDDDYYRVDVSVYVSPEGPTGDDTDSWYFTMEGAEDDE